MRLPLIAVNLEVLFIQKNETVPSDPVGAVKLRSSESRTVSSYQSDLRCATFRVKSFFSPIS